MPVVELTLVLLCLDDVASFTVHGESQRCVSSCSASPTRLHYRACHTTADRMEAHRQSDESRDDHGAGGLRKRAWERVGSSDWLGVPCCPGLGSHVGP